jgi:hypothetical protein
VNAYSDRPNLASSYNASRIIVGMPSEWFDPSMFAVQSPGHLGNAGRGILTAPGLFNWDLSMNKDTKLALLGEAGNLEFRAEFFNVFNHANFGQPVPSINLQPVQINTFTTVGPGVITQARDGRDIQLALKLNF